MRYNVLQEHLHPNHFFVFNYKIWILELSLENEISRNTKAEKVHLSEDDQNDHIRNQISLLDLQMKYHGDVLSIVEILDPGPTESNAEHYKRMAQRRAQLSQLKMIAETESYSKVPHVTEMELAISEFKKASLSFDYPEKKYLKRHE